jgi:hypothetical protein
MGRSSGSGRGSGVGDRFIGGSGTKRGDQTMSSVVRIAETLVERVFKTYGIQGRSEMRVNFIMFVGNPLYTPKRVQLT